jgi:hypothetical protein
LLQISYNRTAKALPDSAIMGGLAKDGDVLFPEQVSFFYAGKIADELGAFVQLTYDGVGDHFGLDNTDVRYAHHLSFGGTDGNAHSLLLGITLNNNPTVQDVWNTTPAWGYPYAASPVVPSPITSAKIDSGAGGFGQTVGGLGVYAWFDDHFYAEITDYDSKSAPSGSMPALTPEQGPCSPARPISTRTRRSMRNTNSSAKIIFLRRWPRTSTRNRCSTPASWTASRRL